MDDFEADFVHNNSLPGDGELPGDEPGATFDLPLMVFRLLVCTTGTIGNLLVIFVILFLREYKNAVTHWYVLQLAIADTLFLLTLPFKIVEDLHDEWIFPDAMCRIKEGILFLNYYSSVVFLTVMSIDRYIAVCHRFATGLQRLRTQMAAYIISGVVWLVCLLLCIPVFAYTSKMGIHPHCKCQYEFPNSKQSPEENCQASTVGLPEAEYIACLEVERKLASLDRCTVIDYKEFDEIFGDYSGGDNDYDENDDYAANEDDISNSSDDVYEHGCTYALSGPGWKAFMSFNFVVMFAIPFIIMLVCYTSIIIRLTPKGPLISQSGTEDGPTSTGASVIVEERQLSESSFKKAENNRNRVTIMCGALVALFLICWLPYYTIHLAKMNGIHGSSEFCLKLTSIASLVAYVNSALNPYVYHFIGTRFGKRLRLATGRLRKSAKKFTSSLSGSEGAVRYQAKKHAGSESSSTGNTGTVVMKIYQGKCQPGSSCEDVGQNYEEQPLVEIKNSRSTADRH